MLRSAPAATPVDAIAINTTSTNVSTLWIEFELTHQSGDSVSGSTPVEPEHELLPNLLQIVKEEDKNGSTMHNDDVGDGTSGVPTTTN